MNRLAPGFLVLSAFLFLAGCGDFPELEAPDAGPSGGTAAGGEQGGGGSGPAGIGGPGGSEAPTPPWTFANSDEGEAPKSADEEAAKRSSNPRAVAFSETFGDPTTVVDDEIRLLATVALWSWNLEGTQIDQLLENLGIDRSQAQSGFRALADDTLRSLAFQHTLRRYQQLQLEGEFTPEVPYESRGIGLPIGAAEADAEAEADADSARP